MEQEYTTAREVFYALTDEENKNVGHRSAKLLSLLSAHLLKRNLIDEAELSSLVKEALR